VILLKTKLIDKLLLKTIDITNKMLEDKKYKRIGFFL